MKLKTILKPYRYLEYLVCLILCAHQGGAQTQGKWSAWEPLYNDSYITVEIKFFYPDITTCSANGRDFKYQYRVKGQYRSTPYYLSWKLDYIDCNGDLNYQVNSIVIGKSSPEDISNWISVASMEYRVSAASLEEKHYDVTASSTPRSGTGTKVLQYSKEPERIEGVRKVYMGEAIELNVKGGSLGIGADWVWYEDSCGGLMLGKGKIIQLSPTEDMLIFVRAEGRYNVTRCVKASILVDKNSLAPAGITGRAKICKGEVAVLAVEGGALGLGAKWVWYADACGSKKIGSGKSITVNPGETTTYFVRAEGALNTTSCASLQVSVNGKSLDPVSISASETNICEGTSITLQVKGGRLAQDANWQWYAGSCGGSAVGKGVSVNLAPSSSTTFYVRGEGVCNYTACVDLRVNVERKLHSKGSISAPSIVYKGKRTKLSVKNDYLDAGAQWHWFKGDCESGTYLGNGPTLIVRPRTRTSYFVKAVGHCNETSCAQILINPVRKHSGDRYYDDKSKFLHFGWGIGLEGILFQAYAQHFTPNSSGHDYFNIAGMGMPGEVVFHPFIKENVSFGLNFQGSIGVSPYILTEGKKNSQDGDVSQEKYFYTRWGYGGEFAFGLRKLKLLFSLNQFTQKNKFSNEASVLGGKEIYRFDETTHVQTFGAGIRMGRYLHNWDKGGNSIDVMYTFTHDLDKGFPYFDLNDISQGVQGISISWWKHSRFKFRLDFTFPNEDSSFGNFKNSTFQLTAMLHRSWFY